PPRPPARGTGRKVLLGVTAGVVALALSGGFYLLGRDSGGSGPADRAGAGPGTSAAPSVPDGPQNRGGPGGGSGGGDGGSADPRQPQSEAGYATDAASGISIPVPDGWTGQSGTLGAGVTTGKYTCPGGASADCVRGGVFSAPAVALKLTATTAKESAEKDIRANAEESYGSESYGAISSHEELKSEAVTVAGQKGYLVRWKVVTSKGDDGYVQSLVFPSPRTSGMLVVVRSGFDINDKAPKLSVMDTITRGIKAAAGTSGAGRGV
ncbi:hypothetical protein ACIOEX_27260, partial [Streptomyces sp. NPDC087850]